MLRVRDILRVVDILFFARSTFCRVFSAANYVLGRFSIFHTKESTQYRSIFTADYSLEIFFIFHIFSVRVEDIFFISH